MIVNMYNVQLHMYMYMYAHKQTPPGINIANKNVIQLRKRPLFEGFCKVYIIATATYKTTCSLALSSSCKDHVVIVNTLYFV